MLDYTLEANELTEKQGDLCAQVINVVSHTQDDIIDRILKTGAGLTRSDILSVLENEIHRHFIAIMIVVRALMCDRRCLQRAG